VRLRNDRDWNLGACARLPRNGAFVSGERDEETAARFLRRAESRAGRRLLVERTLPAVPEQAAAVALAGLRSMARAPEVKMGLATNVVIFAVLGAGMLLRREGALSETVRPFAASGAVAMTFIDYRN